MEAVRDEQPVIWGHAMSNNIWSFAAITAATVAIIAAHIAHRACSRAEAALAAANAACSLRMEKLSSLISESRAAVLWDSQLLAAMIRQFEASEMSPNSCEVMANLTPASPSSSKCFKNPSDFGITEAPYNVMYTAKLAT